MPPNQRSARITYHFDPGTVPSMKDRIYPALLRNLEITLLPVANSVLAEAQKMLVLLPPEHVPYDSKMGGRATGTMADSLVTWLIGGIENAVLYGLKSDAAYYWEWIEFGHFVRTKDGPQFWEGYHFFERTIKAHEGAIHKAALEAWHMAILQTGGGGASRLSSAAISALSAKGG